LTEGRRMRVKMMETSGKNMKTLPLLRFLRCSPPRE
jgi:hypothetical protein